ncbi:hypothetical protein J3R30DRAFT_2170695 [Lentinula aciculospora]|uniref:Uncharacterized protein n=1 Tax=Lentinula aciculospora TaxID=153920 RepID=A0A9W9AIJ8_9AGAR|nr:hypothetical protein J3R30DRAFT_2170695 [Lentinula aciculospora]
MLSGLRNMYLDINQLKWCRLNTHIPCRLCSQKRLGCMADTKYPTEGFATTSDFVALYQRYVRCKTCTVLRLQCSRELTERRWRLQQVMGLSDDDSVSMDKSSRETSRRILISLCSNKSSATTIVSNPSLSTLPRLEQGPDPTILRPVQLTAQNSLIPVFRRAFTELGAQLQISQARNTELVKENQLKESKLSALEAELVSTRNMLQAHNHLSQTTNSTQAMNKWRQVSLKAQHVDLVENAYTKRQSVEEKHIQTVPELNTQYDVEDLVQQKDDLQKRCDEMRVLLEEIYAQALSEKERTLSALEEALVKLRQDNQVLSHRLEEYERNPTSRATDKSLHVDKADCEAPSYRDEEVKFLREKFLDMKEKNNLLLQNLTDHRYREANGLQTDLIEHANIQVLIPLLRLAREDFAAK